jgi:hypothetical protein
MSPKLEITICAPPHRERHVAEIGFSTDEIKEPGTHGCYCPIAEITIDRGFMETEFHPMTDAEVRRFDLANFMNALAEGKRRLRDFYPEFE